MFQLIPVNYRNKEYPCGIVCKINEVAAHFDKKSIKINNNYYSLHTEYSYGKRKLDTDTINEFQELLSANKKVYLNYGIVKNGQKNLHFLSKR